MVKVLRKVMDFFFPVRFGVIGQNPRYPNWLVYGPFKGQEGALEFASEMSEEAMLEGTGWFFGVIRWNVIPSELRRGAHRGS